MPGLSLEAETSLKPIPKIHLRITRDKIWKLSDLLQPDLPRLGTPPAVEAP